MNIQSNEEITLDKLYREIVESRNDLKGAIEASETTLLLKLESLNQKTQKLERENKILKEKIEALEKQNIKNNLVIFGLPNKHDEVTAQSVVQEINRLLQIELSESDINDVYSLGKGINKPIKREGRSQSPLQVISRTPAQEKKDINREPTAQFNNIKLNKPEASQKIDLTLGAIKKVGEIAGGGPRTRNKSQK
ncbi:hypothetical protein WA026_018085 [Henosepilachna vigintioctopunctata]|uniref:Uncharacterized protein n=1 Tax=Henosepilachna vigintioctopunctata TaxID=420089 RepID=A0AAW1UM73_9CUCU